MLAPICLFTYNRLSETKQTIEALKNNYLAKESDLIIFSDGPKNEDSRFKVEQVRKYIKNAAGFKTVKIIESPVNKGLANSIISGVSKVFENYENVIVLEDDLITKPNFLNFMNDCLVAFESNENIQSINGYSPLIKLKYAQDIYLHIRTFSWGWATWKRNWNENIFNKQQIREIATKQTLNKFANECGSDVNVMLQNALNDKIDSWYIFWTFDHFIHKHYAIYPMISLVENFGYSKEGTHCNGIQSIQSSYSEQNEFIYKIDLNIKPNLKIIKQFNSYFSYRYRILFRLKLLKNPKNLRPLVEEVILKIKNNVK